MKRLHLLAVASSISLSLAGVLVACSSDDTIVTNEAPGPEFDGSTDRPAPDTSVPDAATDATADAETDAAEVFTVETYDERVAETLCNALTRCCYDNADVPQDGGVDGGDAGSGFFNRASCLKLYSVLGFENSSVGLTVTTDHIAINQAKANDCVAKINTLACNLDGASLKSIRSACFDAVEGDLAPGSQCQTSAQCTAGNFCLPTQADGGPAVPDGGPIGTCQALRGDGGSCNVVDTTTGSPKSHNASDSLESEIACSYRGGGDTGLACSSYDSVTGVYKSDRSQWTCAPAVANGEICNSTVSCADGICDPGLDGEKYRCEPVLTYFDQNVCSYYVKK